MWAFNVLVETANRDAWSWSAIESIGTWFAGLGTLAAVVVSLFLARQSDRKVERKDYLRARMTALGYIGRVIKVHADLMFLKHWSETRDSLPTNPTGDTEVIQRAASLKLDVPFDDLVMLSPIEKHFAERLHALTLQLETCSSAANLVQSALSLVYHTQNKEDAEQLAACGAHLQIALSEVGQHTCNALKLLNPLFAACANVQANRRDTKFVATVCFRPARVVPPAIPRTTLHVLGLTECAFDSDHHTPEVGEVHSAVVQWRDPTKRIPCISLVRSIVRALESVIATHPHSLNADLRERVRNRR